MFGLGWWAPRCGCCDDLRALTECQIAAQIAAQARMMANSDGSIFAHLMANYRPPVHVPEGWADWFEHGAAIT